MHPQGSTSPSRNGTPSCAGTRKSAPWPISSRAKSARRTNMMRSRKNILCRGLCGSWGMSSSMSGRYRFEYNSSLVFLADMEYAQIDIEGWEFATLTAIIESLKGKPLLFGQMKIEIHLNYEPDCPFFLILSV
jgi:hypothetical protein